MSNNTDSDDFNERLWQAHCEQLRKEYERGRAEALVHPILWRFEVQDIEGALDTLLTTYALPDGTEVLDGRALRLYRRQIEDGYYMGLVWAPGVTPEQIQAWHARAAEIVRWHKLGVL